MVVNRRDGSIQHRHFYQIGTYLAPDDVLVINRSRVIPARLFGFMDNGTKVEVMLLHQLSPPIWACLVHPGKRLKSSQTLWFGDKLQGLVSQGDEEGIRTITFSCAGDFFSVLSEYGHVPLPPYIEREDTRADISSYQTVYARDEGSVAAPTAGLHFTEELLKNLAGKGIQIADVILHVGLGTFRPVKTEELTQHNMHAEFCQVPAETASPVNHAKRQGNKVVAVGTTTVRTLESFAENGVLTSGQKWTDLFIYPGKNIQIPDAVITNFHLPCSTLLMMMAAFAGYELLMQAYQQAIEQAYRFFSYGDAMLIL